MNYEIIIVFLLLPIICRAVVDPAPIAKPNCPSNCGEVTIPYPFGIGPGCFLEERYEITCENQPRHDIPTQAILKKSSLFVLNISLHNSYLLIGQLRGSAITNSSCVAVYMRNDTVGCVNYTESSVPDLKDTPFVFSELGPSYNYVQLRLEWGLTNDTFWSNPGMISNNSVRRFSNFSTGASLRQYSCEWGYQGNPYLDNGCQDIDECLEFPERACPHGRCVNWPGSYYCADDSKSKSTAIIAGTTTGIGVLFFLFLGWWLHKVFKKRKETKLKEKYFKQNGGLLLQQQLYSNEGTTMEKSKVFTSKELDKATDHFNENRILGQGGQGTVYKGMLVDGSIVAIKKSKIEDLTKLHQFINEVVILSQISHRNVVKLLGCCLETEVPLLVYEFVPNGTLYQYLHNPTEEFALSWDIRLRISSEIAEALSYLHFAAAIPIYHRDIKSSNILLDEKYRAKIADFGTSKSVALDQTHVTTMVQGTFGYLDPEYFQSSQFTDKSDVYSFGVVLIELLTGQKAISSLREDGALKGLAAYFIHSLENDYFLDVVDPELLKKGMMEEIKKVAYLAKRCLNLKGKNRPSMREVVMELEGIRRLRSFHLEEGKQEEYEYGGSAELHGIWDVESSKATSLSDDQPLLSIKTM